MDVSSFRSGPDSPRKKILPAIHETVIGADKRVGPAVGRMMGRKMINYMEEGIFKYALSSAKVYMSLHVMPMYRSPIHSRYV